MRTLHAAALSLASLSLVACLAVGCAAPVDEAEPVALEDALEGPDPVEAEETPEPEEALPSAQTPVVREDAACPRVRIHVTSGNLNIRESPNTGAAILGQLSNGAILDVLERVNGEVVSGNPGWVKVASSPRHGFVSAFYAHCTTDTGPVVQPGAFRLPLACGTSARISQGNDGSTSHSGRAKYAFDFAIPLNTPLVAMADGVVRFVYAETQPGEPCYSGGGSSCFPHANYVFLRHGDGSASIYKHLNRVDVRVGESVRSGQQIGLSGSTGYSTGPHAHVMRQENCNTPTACQSIPLTFADVPNGVPTQGQTVTSRNCN